MRTHLRWQHRPRRSRRRPHPRRPALGLQNQPPPGRDEIHHLVGYFLLDYNDQYRINRLGLYLSRQGGLITWDIDELLTHLGARHTPANLRTLLPHRLRTKPT